MGRIVVYNAIKTPDGTVLISRHRHDYVSHVDSVTKETYLTDGGNGSYVRRSTNIIPAEDLSVYDDAPHEKIRGIVERGTHGINRDEPLRYVFLKDIDNAWLDNIISYEQEFRPNNTYLKTYLAEKEFRQKNKPPLEYYLICVGRSLSNYSYDSISILNNTVYFIDSYNKNISVKDSLDNFSKYNG